MRGDGGGEVGAAEPRACVLGPVTDALVGMRAAEVREAVGLAGLRLPTRELVLVGEAVARGRATHADEGERTFAAVADGNRSAIVPDVRAVLGGRGYVLSVKGVGALTPLYEVEADVEVGIDAGARVGAAPMAGARGSGRRRLGGESWFGEAPYGAQGPVGALRALEVSALADGACLAGVYICPLVAAHRIPEALVDRESFWYRRWRGPCWQEHRLVPSNVRLFSESAHTLAHTASVVLDAFGVGDREAFDAFVERYLRSGVAALTLFARTLREGEHGVEGLDYDDVWLDKDSLVAPDGTLHFADLEALEWTSGSGYWTIAERVVKQVERNAYELFFALDAVLREGERRLAEPLTRAERRSVLADRLELALAGDPFVRAERVPDGIDLVVLPRGPMRDPVTVRLLDTR